MPRTIKDIRGELEDAVLKYAMGDHAHLNRLAVELLALAEIGAVPLDLSFDAPTTASVRPIDPRHRYGSVA